MLQKSSIKQILIITERIINYTQKQPKDFKAHSSFILIYNLQCLVHLEQFLAYLDVLAGMAALVGEAAVAPATGLPARKPARTRSRKRASKTESISSTPINTETTTG